MEEFCGEPLLSLDSSWNTSSPTLSQCLSRTVSTLFIIIAIAIAVVIAIVTLICFQQLCPGTTDPPNCDPPPLHYRLPAEAQEVCHKLPGWSQNSVFLEASLNF